MKLPSPAVPGVITIASGLLIYEVVAGGGRPTVLTALTGLLLSPVALKLDEARRAEKAKDSTAEDTA